MDLAAIGPALHTFWTVWLVLLFVGILGYALWPGNRDRFDAASRIPLNENGQEG